MVSETKWVITLFLVCKGMTIGKVYSTFAKLLTVRQTHRIPVMFSLSTLF